jgi:hypothetical protein
VSERVQLKSAYEEKTGRLVQNGRQPGTLLVELSVDKSPVRAAARTGCESGKIEAVAWKRLVEALID